jgi:hypothetical protein
MAKSSKNLYVADRVGELVDFANPLTFDLLEKIFGFNGPYRKILYQFGGGDLTKKESYLKNVCGKVYSDIGVENKVLWNPCSFKLTYVKNCPVFSFKFTGLLALVNFVTKFFKESLVTAFPSIYCVLAQKSYREFSKAVETAYKKQKISVAHFLKLYEKVVYISYLYDLVFGLNNSKKLGRFPKVLKDYVAENDYLLKGEKGFGEFKYSNGFKLGTKGGARGGFKEELVPGCIEIFEGPVKPMLILEAYLQCLKNNMRLKTDLLLYFLNKDLKKKCVSYGISDFGFLTFAEIGRLDEKNVLDLKMQVRERKKYYARCDYKKLPNIVSSTDDQFLKWF